MKKSAEAVQTVVRRVSVIMVESTRMSVEAVMVG
jgi:hypothetical protein